MFYPLYLTSAVFLTSLSMKIIYMLYKRHLNPKKNLKKCMIEWENWLKDWNKQIENHKKFNKWLRDYNRNRWNEIIEEENKEKK
jgi:hypothetical protein